MKILLAPYSRQLRNGGQNPKNYPWFPELLSKFGDHEVIQIGVEGEAQLVPDFRKGLSHRNLLDLTASVDFFLSVDSFLPHLAKHVGKTGAVIWGKSDPEIFGYPENLNLLKSRACLRKNQFLWWEQETFDPDVFLPPDEVYKAIRNRFLTKR